MRMRNACILFGACCIIILSLAGCWDIRSVQDINYITALGIDYKDGKYVVYTQSLDFSNVAKQEGMKSTGKTPVWVGRGEGYSLDSAVNDLYTTSSLQILWDHTTVIIFSEHALQQDVNKMIDSVFRFSGIRYTPWVFGTKESIPDLFILPIPFNQSPVASILHAPNDVLKQQAYIPPVQLYRMVVELNEPGSTLLLPSMSINKKKWTENDKEVDQYQINGVYALQDGIFQSWFNLKHMHGIRWLSEKITRTPINIGSGEKPEAVLALTKPKSSLSVAIRGLDPKFKLKIDVNGYIEEVMGSLSEAEIISLAKQEIRDEVRHTWEQGLRKKVDVYSLRKYVYRNCNKMWKRAQNGALLQLTPDSLDSIEVNVHIEHAGMNRLRR
ncbi:Ger(x)C family spore germination protein [Paenibacillus profundus]|uniref:Ger(X)C family spore germination protein n=1 Tax=Paenibacillus profundus TaxID=1173085 RepID=A0ABS8YIG2_9BACL|nr:Ger(x)C family spore germination protein [Paenibacillus profundus]MCE5170002.1 Ger(x)C family spore germination protein [Paenibacillus profundus]